jgi:hypothetical protein
VLVSATVSVTYQTSTSLTLPSLLWNPEEWTTIIAKFTDLESYPQVIIQNLPGFRAFSTTATTFDGGLSTATQQRCLDVRVLPATAGTPYSLQLTGGPANPEGNTYTIGKPTLEPAFVDYAGTQYYRKTVVVATIPAQPALPV